MTAGTWRGRAPQRRAELGLVLLATIIIAATYSLASLANSSALPANIVPFLGVILGLLALAHIAMRRFAPGADPVLLPLAGLLNGIGYVFIARLDVTNTEVKQLAGLQALWTAMAITAFVGTLVLVKRVRDLDRYRYTFALLGVFLLLMPLLPGIGRNIHGARIWVSLGPMSLQPGELAKLALSIFFASYLIEKRELLSTATRRLGPIMVPDLKHFGPLLLMWGISLVVMFYERDLGSSLLFFALFVAVLWVGTGRAVYLLLGALLFAVGALIAWKTFGHVEQRVDIWLDPWEDSDGQGYQLVQSMFSLGTGGVTGTGIGLGAPEKIPEAKTDFIFAAIGEELGFMGAAAVLIAYLLMVGAGLRIALRAESPFEKLLAAGLTAILGIQTFIILGGVTRLVPLTGITLPFMSYGGSSLLANYVLLALLLKISHDNRDAPILEDA